MELNLRPVLYKSTALPTELKVLTRELALPLIRILPSLQPMSATATTVTDFTLGYMCRSPFSARGLPITP